MKKLFLFFISTVYALDYPQVPDGFEERFQPIPSLNRNQKEEGRKLVHDLETFMNEHCQKSNQACLAMAHELGTRSQKIWTDRHASEIYLKVLKEVRDGLEQNAKLIEDNQSSPEIQMEIKRRYYDVIDLIHHYADHTPDGPAMGAIGFHYLKLNQPEKALPYLEKAVERHNMIGHLNLALLWYEGTETRLIKDDKEACRILNKGEQQSEYFHSALTLYGCPTRADFEKMKSEKTP